MRPSLAWRNLSSRAFPVTRPIAKLAAATAAAQRASLARAPTPSVLGEDGAEEAARAREEAAEFRANDATVGADAVVAGAATAERPAPRTYRTRAVRAAEAADPPAGAGGGGTERKPRGPLRPTADGPVEHEGRWSRGGFRPRLPGPDRTDSEHGDGATVWPGNR
jgi:hypothetical protein